MAEIKRKIYVRRQGNVCTVFLDGAGTPVVFTDFHVPPPDFPQTCAQEELPFRYPNADFVFIEETTAPPPESHISAEVIETGLAQFKLSGKTQGTQLVQPVLPHSVLGDYEGHEAELSLCGDIEKELRERITAWRISKDSSDLAELEAICGFLLTVNEKLFDGLIKELMTPPSAKEKKKVKLG